MDSYQEFAPELVAKGYDPTPLNGKRPILNGWPERPATAHDFDKYNGHNTGVVLGGPANIIAIDVDVPFEPAAGIIREWIGDNLPAMPERVGAAPKTLFVARSERPRSKVASAKFVKVDHGTGEIVCETDGKEIKVAIEVLAEGQQFVASGIHPDTNRAYEWPGDNLIDFCADELPVVSDAQISELLTFAENTLERYFTRPDFFDDPALSGSGKLNLRDTPSLSTVQEALGFIDAGDYDQWVRVGLALHGDYGDDGLAAWDAWSATSKKYQPNGADSCAAKWKSFKRPRPGVKRITVGSILHLARQAGWTQVEDSMVSTCDHMILDSEEFVGGFTAPDYLVDGIVQRRYLYSLTARTGDGKTAVLLTLAAMVALGRSFGNAETSVGRVCYFAGENPDDVRARCLLMASVFKFDANSIDVHFIPGTFSIPEMFERIAKESEEIGGFDLVIIDTSAAYFQGNEENSNTQVGNHARDLRELTTLPGGPCVIVACHPTKNPSRENLLPRGGGAFTAEVDGNLTLWSDDKVTTELSWAGKFRGPDFEPMAFKMEERTVDTVHDSKGRPMPSVIALPVTDAEAQAHLAQTLRNEDAVLVAMLDHPGASMAQIASELGWLTGKMNTPYSTKVERAIHILEKDYMVKQHRGRTWYLTKYGETEAEKIKQSDQQGFFK